MDPAFSPSRRARRALAASLVAVAAIATASAPASAAEPASATPVADTLKATTEAVVPADAPAVVEQTVPPVAAPVRSTVDTVAAAKPVRTAVDTLRAPVEQAIAPVRPAIAAGLDRSPALRVTGSTQAQSPAGPASERPGSGRIDRNAITRRGADRDDGDSGIGFAADSLLAATAPLQGGLATIVDQARTGASSTFASGGDENDPLDGLPLGPGDGTSLLAGPVGIALLGLGLLVAMLTVIPRFCSSLLPDAPARWGLAAFRLPIERPG